MNILMTGGTGFIGSKFRQHFPDYRYTLLTRKPHEPNSYKSLTDIPDTKFDIVINLAGAAIDKVWTKSYKQEIINSRVQLTKDLIAYLGQLPVKPKLLISASAIGFYGNQKGELDESSSGSPSFSQQLCSSWEREALLAKEHGIAVCIARLGVVLGDGGMLAKLKLPFKLGLGGRIGSGAQYLSWVHINDLIRCFNYFIQETKHGIYNITAPYPVTNEQFSRALGRVLKRPTFISVPAWLIKLTQGQMGQELILDGSKVLPRRLEDEGFRFEYSHIEPALASIL